MTDKINSAPLVWISGASRGIGAAAARHLAAAGYRLALSARTGAQLESVAAECAPAQVCVAPCDVRSAESVDAAHAAIAEKCGPVDVLIANAGIGIFKLFTELSATDFDESYAVNVRGVVNTVRAALPAMLERKRGTLMFIQSIAVDTGFAACTAYGATKAATLAFSRSLRTEVREQGLKVVNLIPGATETDIWRPEARAEFRARMMQPADLAPIIGNILALHPRVMVEDVVIRPQLGDL